MQISRHLYAIAGIAVLLTAVSFGSKGTVRQQKATSVLVTNSAVPVTLSGAQSINVKSSKDAPVLVRDVDAAARVHVDGTESDSGQAFGVDVDLYEVPVGKRLIVEGMSIRAFGPAIEVVAMSAQRESPSGDFLSYGVVAHSQGTNGFGNAIYVGTIDTPLHITGGTKLVASVSKNTINDVTMTVVASFTGYLVDEPVAAP
jgi:hypothetical protein